MATSYDVHILIPLLPFLTYGYALQGVVVKAAGHDAL